MFLIVIFFFPQRIWFETQTTFVHSPHWKKKFLRRKDEMPRFPSPPNDPNPTDEIKSLKYIGPYLAERWDNLGIQTLDVLVQVMKRQYREQKKTRKRLNTELFQEAFQNERPNQCVGPARDRGNQYSVRPFNLMGWNVLVWWLKRHRARDFPDLELEVIPNFLPRPRPIKQDFPDRCRI